MKTDRWAGFLFLLISLGVGVILGGGAFFLAVRAAAFFREVKPAVFFLDLTWAPPATYGVLPFLVGSLLVTSLSLALAFFPGLAAAIYVARGRRSLGFGLEILGGIPAVVLGWLALKEILPFLGRLSGTGGYGPGAAGLILAVMVLPTFALLSARALERVPATYTEAALALGATPWEAVRGVDLPLAWPGVRSALILAATRALGETMAVQAVIGNAPVVPGGLFAPAVTFTSWIATELGHSPYGTPEADSLFTMGFLLLGMALLGAIFGRGRSGSV